jgi:hypothetical protein
MTQREQETPAVGSQVDRGVRPADPERAAFEDWQSDSGRWPKAVERAGEGYKLAASHAAWTAWRAGWVRARNAERERYMAALQEADTLMGHEDHFTEWREKWAGLWPNVGGEAGPTGAPT